MAWYFLGSFSRICDGHPYPFYPEVPPPGVVIFLVLAKKFKEVQKELELFYV